MKDKEPIMVRCDNADNCRSDTCTSRKWHPAVKSDRYGLGMCYGHPKYCGYCGKIVECKPQNG